MLKTLLLFLFLPLISSILLYFYFLSRPIHSITLSNNVSSPVEIIRDSSGLAHISSDSLEDAIYGLGFAMCQDRMWQIDMMRRLATGRMSELFGAKTLELDKFARNMKILRSAEDDINSLSPSERKIGERFVDGVNDAAAMNWKPINYFLTGSHWENLTIAESQSNIYFVALFLSNIWGSDALKVQLKKVLGDEVEFLMPANVELIRPKNFCVDNEEMDERIQGPPENLKSSNFSEYLEFFTDIFDMGAGSNSWVISGQHTRSGKPVLSNDPHLSSTIPSPMYLSHLRVKDYSQFGANLIGVPISSIGRNKMFSWGATSLKVDDIDIYAEKVVNNTHYVFGEIILPFEFFQENIKIKGQEDFEITFRQTVHGPMIENSIVGVKKNSETFGLRSSKDLSVCWASLFQKDKSFGVVSKVFKAKSIEEFRDAHSKSFVVRLSVIVASVDGDIAYLTTGRVPIKSYKGDQILPGWIPETKWKGFIPFTEMPFTLNPKKGFIVTANNFIAGPKFKYFESLGTYFSVARADRITELIQAKIHSGHKFTSEDQLELLKDELDIFARHFLPVLLKNLRKTQNFSSEIQELENWDYVMRRESKAAGIYARWTIEIISGLLKDKVKDELLFAFLRNQVMTNNFYHFFQDYYQDLSKFCDNPKTGQRESCEDLINEGFVKAVAYVDGRTWGEMHKETLKHIPFSDVYGLKWIFERSQYLGGNSNTVHATFINWNATFEVFQSPGLKMVTDMGNSSAFYFAVEAGMSENVFSSHYSDMMSGYHYGDIPRLGFY